jgi:integrase/recombinase XerD
MNELTAAITEEENPLSEQRLNNALDGLEDYYYDHLKNRIPKLNALMIADYVLAMKVETNPSPNHKRGVVTSLKLLSQFSDNKPFKEMTKENILAFLDSIRRPETKDPTHKWIGTYNQRLINSVRFFKWLYFPDIEPSKRQPEVVENIPTLKRKEKSKYKASDLWTKQEHVIFLNYCGNKRDRCYHAMAIDTGCRPSELLKLRIKDIVFKTAENSTQYAEIQVNGKTGNRIIPLIVCIPYVKDWIDDHPQRSNPQAYLFCGLKKNFGRALTRATLYNTYVLHYKEEAFPRLLQDTNVPTADKLIIKDLLKKPWNPYIQRHNSMTEKAKILKESLLNIHAGWTPNSKMPQTYLHYFGNESSETLLEAAGIITKDKKVDPLKPKQCPNCSEPNKPDSRFCVNCRYILTYDAYDETLQGQKENENRLFTLENQVKSLLSTLGNMEGQQKIDFAKALFVGGLFKKE